MSHIMQPPTLASARRWRGLRVGVFGGSFDPAHAGHLHVAQQALTYFGLDAVWWLISPGNPLKTDAARDDMDARLADVNTLIAGHPHMVASDLERQMDTRYAIETATALREHFADTDFVWIAGMDNAANFKAWRGWQDLPRLMPFAFFDRPPALNKLKSAGLRRNKLFAHYTQFDGTLKTGIYWILGGQTLDISSSALRHNKG